jgi:hypothetical protein
MKKKLLEEAVKNRWKKLAGINEITRDKRRELDWEWRQEKAALQKAKEAEAKKKWEQSPEGQASIQNKIYNDKAIKPALEKVLGDVTDGWEKDFIERFSRVLQGKFFDEKTNLEVAAPEAEYKLDKYKQQYRDWFREQGISDYRTAVSSMNWDKQQAFEKPLFDMMKTLAAEPFDSSMATQGEPEEEEDLSHMYTQAGDTDFSNKELAQQARREKDLDRRGMFGAFGRKGFRGVAENKKIRVKSKNVK